MYAIYVISARYYAEHNNNIKLVMDGSNITILS